MYKLQPKGRLFLCDSCLLYLPSIEIKCHHMECKAPKDYSDYLTRWERLIQLLQEIYRVSCSDELFRLVELMLAYPSGRKTRLQGIYSQQLERILTFRHLMVLAELKADDLFSCVEKIGDRLETVGREAPGWLLCS
jgi:hypothetical protein